MRTLFKQILCLAAVAPIWFFSACGFDVNGTRSNKDESYSYEFEENGCKTGAHRFDDKGDYCAALLNDGLNHGCAATIRRQRHQDEC